MTAVLVIGAAGTVRGHAVPLAEVAGHRFVASDTPSLPRPRGRPLATPVHPGDVADEDANAVRERVAQILRACGLPTVPTGSLPQPALDALARLRAGRDAYPRVDRAAHALRRLSVRRHGLETAPRVRLDREALSPLHDDLGVDAATLPALGRRPRSPRFAEWRHVLRWVQAERWVPRHA